MSLLISTISVRHAPLDRLPSFGKEGPGEICQIALRKNPPLPPLAKGDVKSARADAIQKHALGQEWDDGIFVDIRFAPRPHRGQRIELLKGSRPTARGFSADYARCLRNCAAFELSLTGSTWIGDIPRRRFFS
jgi:hypothetical protein